MNIYIMNPETLDRLAIINDYSARNWNRVWGESGSFTIWAPSTPENEEFLIKENLIWPDNQKCIGVIEHIHKYIDEDSHLALMEVSGRFIAASYLYRRIIWGNTLLTANPATVISTIVRDQAIASTDLNRRFGNTVSTSIDISNNVQPHSNITYCNSYGNLWEQVMGLSLEYNLDLEFEYDPSVSISTIKGLISEGSDKSLEVNLSTDLGFLTGSDYVLDSTEYCNVALIAGEGEGSERIVTSIIPTTATKRDRRELYVDARDLQKTSASTQEPMSDETYTDALKQRGQKTLLDYPLYESYECNLQLTGEEGYVFDQDYRLGDIVTLTDHIIGVQVQAIVKEHQISEDKDGRTDILIFGVSVPTITSIIKKRD